MGKKGLTIERYFSKEGKAPESYFDWEKTDIDVVDDQRKKLFTQDQVEVPKHWSALARQMAVSKYFFGENNTPQRETSIRDLVGRVSSTFGEWGISQGYFTPVQAKIFQEELATISYSQRASFNSPVWFNVGTYHRATPSKEIKEAWRIAEKDKEITVPTYFGNFKVQVKAGTAIPLELGEDIFYPQTPACFIQPVADTMEGIMDLAKKEALLFKYGSGTGTNLSTLRSSREKLSGGGKPTGPLTYWAFYDKVASSVKSGGKTRRASKMNSLEDTHPDIMEFIDSKKDEERLLRLLQEYGISWERAQESVNYQSTNISMMTSDAFMNAVLNNQEWQTIPVHNKELADKMPKYNARDMLRRLSLATWDCGDPGMQFKDNINRWHTCKAAGPIRASNPCSEYLFLDNSSCNLASQNLMAYFNVDTGTFDTISFINSINVMTTAQDLEIDHSSFPTKEIAQNSHNYRPLGMGYANLGALVMSAGYAYDSDEARAIAASITALMTGAVYENSANLAEKIGTFQEYEKNKESMMEVMHMHKDALKGIDKSKLPKGLENILYEAEKTWERVIEKGTKYGFRNAQATVLAPTGTIGFMMDCDTKGIEPEIGLVQTKLLVGGGSVRLVNQSVEPTLRKLNYNETEITEIKKYITGHDAKENSLLIKPEHAEELNRLKINRKDLFERLKSLGYNNPEEITSYLIGYETIEGAPYIKPEHLPIFDCSNKPRGFKRTISTEGHLKMMAAVQPFLSGAISKTVNMPKEATVEEIEQAYITAWKLGLKAVAIYRDESKSIQPLNFSKKSKLEEKSVVPTRKKMPSTRPGFIHSFTIGEGHDGYISIGQYPDTGKVGEIFIDMNKEGSTVKGLADMLGITTSIALQYGAPLTKIIEKFKHQKFEPRGVVRGHPDIHIATSITDYIGQYLEKQFLEGKDGPIEQPKFPIEQKPSQIEEDHISTEPAGGVCPKCGAPTVMKGHCLEVCSNLGDGCDFTSNKGCGE